jgi:hypothetical protein
VCACVLRVEGHTSGTIGELTALMVGLGLGLAGGRPGGGCCAALGGRSRGEIAVEGAGVGGPGGEGGASERKG